MKGVKIEIKQRIALSSLMIFLLAGCGQQEPSGADVSQEADKQALGARSEAVTEEAQMMQMELEIAPLLDYEDPETKNLAGMLQDTCGSMMVQLEAGRYLGSGILYKQEDNTLVILTAAHVLSDASTGVRVTFVDGWAAESMDFELSGLADIAVVKVSLDQIPVERLADYYLVNVDKTVYDGILAEDGCIVMGCRTGVAEDAYEGIVLEPWVYMEDYDQYMMWVNAAGKPGMSGGGLFDRRGRFLGILSGRSEDGEWAVVPLSFVLTEYG